MSVLGTRSTRLISGAIPLVTSSTKETAAARISLTKAAGPASNPADRAVVSKDELARMKHRDVVIKASYAAVAKLQPAPADLTKLEVVFEDHAFDDYGDLAAQRQSVALADLRGDAKAMSIANPDAEAFRFVVDGYVAIGLIVKGITEMPGVGEVHLRGGLFDAANGKTLATGFTYDSPNFFWIFGPFVTNYSNTEPLDSFKERCEVTAQETFSSASGVSGALRDQVLAAARGYQAVGDIAEAFAKADNASFTVEKAKEGVRGSNVTTVTFKADGKTFGAVFDAAGAKIADIKDDVIYPKLP